MALPFFFGIGRKGQESPLPYRTHRAFSASESTVPGGPCIRGCCSKRGLHLNGMSMSDILLIHNGLLFFYQDQEKQTNPLPPPPRKKKKKKKSFSGEKKTRNQTTIATFPFGPTCLFQASTPTLATDLGRDSCRPGATILTMVGVKRAELLEFLEVELKARC